MKNWVLSLSLFFVANVLWCQRVDLYGFDRRVEFADFVSGDSLILGYGNTWMLVDGKRRLGKQLILWNAENGEQIKVRSIIDREFLNIEGQKFMGLLRKAKLSPDRKRLYILGLQYQGGGRQIKSLFHVYHIDKDSFSYVIADPTKQILDFEFNSEDANKLSCIYIDDEPGIFVGLLDFTELSGIQQLRAYQQLVQPLSIHFSSCNRFLYIGLGINSKQGALEVFDLKTNKLIKKMNTKEHVLGIFDFNNVIYCSGVANSFWYNKSTFKYVKSNQHVLKNFSQTHGKAFVVAQKLEQLSKINIFDLKSAQISSIEMPFNLFESLFNAAGNQILSIVERNEFDQSDEELQKPSVVVQYI